VPDGIEFRNRYSSALPRRAGCDGDKNFGLDLSSYDDVKAHAKAIHMRVEDGSMPCDDAWPKEQVAKFKQWMEDGMLP
jgi:hypothetical protein